MSLGQIVLVLMAYASGNPILLLLANLLTLVNSSLILRLLMHCVLSDIGLVSKMRGLLKFVNIRCVVLVSLMILSLLLKLDLFDRL